MFDQNLIRSAKFLDLSSLAENELSRGYYEVLLRWVRFADTTFQAWDCRPDCGHFFSGSYWYANDTAHPVAVYAALAKAGPYAESLTGIKRGDLICRAITAMRYLCLTHDTGPAGCVRPKGPNPHASGKKWGGATDGFFRAIVHAVPITALGLGAWLLWDELDDDLKHGVSTIVTSFAARWSEEEPRNGAYYDTQSEENACTAMGISFAACMFPQHPDAGLWIAAAKKWLMNCCTWSEARVQSLAPVNNSSNGTWEFTSFPTVALSYTGQKTVLALLHGAIKS